MAALRVGLGGLVDAHVVARSTSSHCAACGISRSPQASSAADTQGTAPGASSGSGNSSSSSSNSNASRLLSGCYQRLAPLTSSQPKLTLPPAQATASSGVQPISSSSSVNGQLRGYYTDSDDEGMPKPISVGTDVAEGDEDGGHVGPALRVGYEGDISGSGGMTPSQWVPSPTFTASGSDVRKTQVGSGTQMLAAVDLGTNSFHMVVVRADMATGNFQILDVEKEDVRLGSGSAGFSIITPEAEDRAIAAIRRLKRIAATRGATLRMVATSAVREARNKRSFIRHVYDRTGVDVEVLTGREEACLIYLGILQALPVYHKTVLTVDIGGGSTEFVIGREGKPLLATSLKLGHIRLTERFAATPVLHRTELEEMRRYIRVLLNDSGVVEAVQNSPAQVELAIGSSGTIETIEQMISLARPTSSNNNGDTAAASSANQTGDNSNRSGSSAAAGGATAGAGSSRGGNGATSSSGDSTEDSRQKLLSFNEKEFTRAELTSLVKRICKAKTVEQRVKIPGLPEKRADVIVGGAILLEEIFLALGITKMKVSPYALREGVIVDTLARSCENFLISTDLRRTSVMGLAHKFNTDQRLDSARHSANLAQQILAGLQTCKTGGQDCVPSAMRMLDMADFEVLEAATILHFVGMFISHKGYHKHSHYLIRNTEQLLGYSPMEVEMISLLVRYHRKKVPSLKDEDFAKLPETIQRKLRALTAIIRIAVALDRCGTGAVERVLILQDNESCVLAVTPSLDEATGQPKDVTLEIWAARQELEYFTKVFRRMASIALVEDLDMDGLDAERSPSLSS